MPTPMSLDQLLDANKPIYVLNKTNTLGKGARGVMVLTLQDQGGRSQKLLIPKTPHPVCLNDQVPPILIRNSPELRRQLTSGALQLLQPDAAEAMLSKPNAASELKRSFQKLKSRSVSEMAGDRPPIADDSRDAEAIRAALAARVEELHPRVASLMLSFEEGEVSAADTLADLRELSDELDARDYGYIIQHAPAGVIHEWAVAEQADALKTGRRAGGQRALVDPRAAEEEQA